jgi:hypothetical protein
MARFKINKCFRYTGVKSTDEEIQSEFQKRHKIMLSQTLKNEEEYREEMSDIVAKEGYRGLQGDEDKGAFDETESEEFKDIPHYNVKLICSLIFNNNNRMGKK